MPGAPLLPANSPQPPHFLCCSNPYRTYDEERLARVQSDLPREVVAYISALFGRRGGLQQIINTVFYHLHNECKSIGLAGYDPNFDNDRAVAAILDQLSGAAETAGYKKVGHQPGCKCETESDEYTFALVDSLEFGGDNRRGRSGSLGSGLPASLAPSNPSALNQIGSGHAGTDPQTPGDADSRSNSEGESQCGSGAAESQTPRSDKDKQRRKRNTKVTG